MAPFDKFQIREYDQNHMRVAILYYPMLFQRVGGLQVQVLETCQALRESGLDAVLFDYRNDRLRDFDIAHVFSAINGNHRIVDQARSDGLPVVLSTVLHPPWPRSSELRSQMISRIASRLSNWSLTTSHQKGSPLLDRSWTGAGSGIAARCPGHLAVRQKRRAQP